MAAGSSHVFRFFADVVGVPGMVVELDPADVQHARVLRLRAGTAVEVVDVASTAWGAVVRDASTVELVAPVQAAGGEPQIELIAGALVGGRFDELVDGAVQAGATRIVPFAAQVRDAVRLAERRERLERIARAAAKQAKRSGIPVVTEPIDEAALLALEPGIVLDGSAAAGLDTALAALSGADVRLLVGPADGLASALVDRLVEQGWRTARLGPSVLRTELAAAVAVAVAAMRATG